MGMHRVDLDVASALTPPHSCPACGSGELLPEPDDRGVVLACPGCGRRWYPELGTLVPAGEEPPAS